MIDLHSHILPGIDDGAIDRAMALGMARLAVQDGISTMVCTPHIVPGLYDNDAAGIAASAQRLQQDLYQAGVPLQLLVGADIHVAPDLDQRLASKEIPTLNGSRYFLFEPPHHVLPPKLEELAERLINAGFVPVLTHPERLTWVAAHYDVLERLNDLGCLIQITAASLLGRFGKSALLHAERLLDEGRVDLLATDAHNVSTRAPSLSLARDFVAARLGHEEALNMVLHRPQMILDNKVLAPVAAARPARIAKPDTGSGAGLLRRFLGRGGRPQ